MSHLCWTDGTARLTGVLGHLEGDLDVTLGTEVVHLSRANLGEDVDQVGAIAEITVMQLHLVRTYTRS